MEFVKYNEQVLQTVAGSGADNTYLAKIEPLAARMENGLEEIKDELKLGHEVKLTRDSQALIDLQDAIAQLRILARALDTAINALGIYSVKSFYTDVKPQTKAAEDLGQYGSWILRNLVPGAT